MSPLSLYHHLLGAALPLFRFLQHFLLVPFLLAHPAPAMEGHKNDAGPGADRAAVAGREGEEERGGVGAEEEGEDETEELDVVEEEDEDEDEEEEEEDEDEEEDGIDYLPESVQRSRSSRTPFTSLSQVDADLALARTLQEQERAYMMLRMGGGGGSDFVGSDSGSEYELHYEDDEGEENDNSAGHGSAAESDYDEDAFDAQDPAVGVDPSAFDNDEAYARALQDAEEREVAVRLMALAGINDWVAEDAREHGGNSQDTWLEVDPDELSYEELIALGEAVGTESRGLAADTIASLPSVSYKSQTTDGGSNDQCVICRLDYEDGDSLIVLSCKHMYHPDCINQWLQINKVCPVCSAEVSTSVDAQG